MSFTHIKSAPARPPRIFWPLLGLVIVLAADGATALILHTVAQGFGDLPNFYLGAPIAALLVGIPAWLHWIVTPRRATITRGLLVGIFGSITAHPVMWILLCMPAFFVPHAAITNVVSLLPLEILYSLIYGGWATTSIGALAGVLLIYLQRNLQFGQQQRVIREAAAIQRRERSGTEAMKITSGREDVRS